MRLSLPENRTDRISLIVSIIIRISLVGAILISILVGKWTALYTSSLTLILTFLPSIIEKNYKISLPSEFEILIIIFIYASIFLGEVRGYYTRIWWWDIFLHTLSGLILGFVGFIILYVLSKNDLIQAQPLLLVIFSFSFAVAFGAIWEIFEFGMDSIFGLNMQKSGLVDTMSDLIVDTIGALIISVAGYHYLKKVETPLFKKLIKRFSRENPKYFKEKQEDIEQG
jgi:hypothetical protein